MTHATICRGAAAPRLLQRERRRHITRRMRDIRRSAHGASLSRARRDVLRCAARFMRGASRRARQERHAPCLMS